MTESGPRVKLGLSATMSPALTIALCLRDDESRLADIANAAVSVAQTLVCEHDAGDWRDCTREEASVSERGDPPTLDARSLGFELLALDECSRDNTLSVLSILHSRMPQLRTIQQLEPGTAVMRAARAATGRVWLLVDAPFDPDHGLWAARQVFCGDQAALVPGEVLAVRRSVGQAALGWHSGGLVGAQRKVEQMLATHGQRAAWSPPSDRALRSQARLFVRSRLASLGLGRFDRRGA